ncbi:MAG: thiamine diphosphokinase [Firmicutes bacterium HGW-Firmicutes-19]|jgi:thiamine pyrophosphokinase|nr:MAG: thiamine diphosphokinase [Firmicutes bacterium HGW-Firmicutes-19]
MLRALLVASMTKQLPEVEYDFLIGVDRGALICAQKGRMMDLAVGDFDSVSSDELDVIKAFCKDIVILNAIKDVTDSQAALAYVEDFDEVILCGGLNGRIDHQLINIGLVKSDVRVRLWDENHLIYAIEGNKTIKKAGYRYLSIFACVPSTIDLEGVKYPLSNQNITENDLYLVSNEIVEEEAFIRVDGKVLIIQSNDA